MEFRQPETEVRQPEMHVVSKQRREKISSSFGDDLGAEKLRTNVEEQERVDVL